MKCKILYSLFFNLSLACCFGQDIQPAPSDKAVIYFARVSSLGFAINFTYFDSTVIIGRFNGTSYIRYECEPGSHLFWARSENKDFVEAEVEAGKIYLIEAAPQMGGIKAGVSLIPVGPADEKRVKKILKLIRKKEPESFTNEELEKESNKFKDIIEKGLEKYNKERGNAKKILRLEKTMHINPNDFKEE